MCSQVVSIRLVEAFLPYRLELETAHHGIEEDLQEVHVIPVGLLHDLHPLNGDGVVHAVVLGRVLRELRHLLEREDAQSVVDEEL